MNEPEYAEPVIVPYTELAPETLQRLVESFVLREGTDYGEREFTLEQKVMHVIRQLERAEAEIVFDPNTETVDIRAVSRGKARRVPDDDRLE